MNIISIFWKYKYVIWNVLSGIVCIVLIFLILNSNSNLTPGKSSVTQINALAPEQDENERHLYGLPSHSLKDFRTGESFDLDKKKQLKIVNFFATWCAPCRIEHPVLEKLAGEYDIPVYAIAFQDTGAKVKAYLEELGDPFMAVALDDDGLASRAWKLNGVPETFVFDADNNLIWRFRGPLTENLVHEGLLPLIKREE